jgi:hypothetical protein
MKPQRRLLTRSVVLKAIGAIACVIALVTLAIQITKDRASDSSGIQILRDLPTPGRISKVVWSSDGSKVAASILAPDGGIPFLFTLPAATGKLILIWNDAGQILHKLEQADSYFFDHDGFDFVASDSQIVAPPSLKSNSFAFSVFDLNSEEILREVGGSNPKGVRPVNAASAIVASPDRSILAIGGFGEGNEPQVVLYSTRDWSKLSFPGSFMPGGVKRLTALAFSNDGKYLATAHSRILIIYDLFSRRIVRAFEPFSENSGTVTALSFSPDGTKIAVGVNAGFVRKGSGVEVEKVAAKDPVRIFVMGNVSTDRNYPGFKSFPEASAVATWNYPEPAYSVESLSWKSDGALWLSSRKAASFIFGIPSMPTFANK